ncbi:cysteine desulfurase family protein [Sanguibacter sp. A247]|uniref:cysteine desulfurase family protein n=1 Tax=unclassified Sanguibacter TaxID=2645534 RepID=UPI003FD803EC
MTETTPSTPAVRSFFDAGGAAPLRPATLEALAAGRREAWSGTRRLHSEGRRAGLLLGAARETIASAIGARTEEVRFAPSHTAAIHAAVGAVAPARRRVGRRIVASAVERSALLAAADHTSPGEVTLVPVDALGRVRTDAFVAALEADGVGLACLQHANSEVGTCQPLGVVHAAARAADVPLLVDGGSSLGHVDVGGSWDVLTADPADWGGPDGIGILAVRARVRSRPAMPDDPDPWFPGGVSTAAAFAAAVSLADARSVQQAEDTRLRSLITYLRDRVAALVEDVDIVGDPDDRLPHVLTFSVLYVDGEAILGELDAAGFAVGSGSACTSLTLQPSHVLAAMGALTQGNVRLTLHPGVTREDVERFCAVLPGAVARVRARLGADVP